MQLAGCEKIIRNYYYVLYVNITFEIRRRSECLLRVYSFHQSPLNRRFVIKLKYIPFKKERKYDLVVKLRLCISTSLNTDFFKLLEPIQYAI